MARKNAWFDEKGPHVRLYHSLVKSHAWAALTGADTRVYIFMRTQLSKTNNGRIPASLSLMRQYGVTSSSTLATALRRLLAAGFIAKTRQGGITQGGKARSYFRFTDVEMYEFPKFGIPATNPTNEWARFKTVEEALAAINPGKSKIKQASKTEPDRSENRTETCARPPRKSNKPKTLASIVESVVSAP